MCARRVAVALCLGALAVAGCGGSDSSDGGNTGTTAAQGDGGGRTDLTVSIGAEPANLDPLLKSDGQRDVWSYSVYDGLTARDGSKIVPGLATEWKLDGDAWVFKLRPNVKFQDGSAFDADDVVASWKRILSEDSELLGSKVVADMKVKKIDPMTVSISRPVADPTTPGRAALVAIAPAEYAKLGDDRLSTTAVGTGPYKFDAWNRGQNIQLSANPDYWGDAPTLQKVTIRFDEEVAVRVAALQAGEIQMALNMSPELAQDSFKREDTPVSEVAHIRLNQQSGPFKDKRLREAANLAIDRQAIIDKIYSGAAGSAGGQEIANYVTGFDKNLKPYPFDPDRARQLVKDAGAEGVKVELWGTRGHWTNDAQLSEAVAGMLNDVGFDVQLKQPPFSDWVEKVFVAETNDAASPDMMIYNHSNELFDASLTVGQNLVCDGASSTTCFPPVDKLAKQALGEIDPGRRQQLYDQIWQTLSDEAAFVSIAEVYKVTFLDKSLSWEPEPDGFVRFQNMEFAA